MLFKGALLFIILASPYSLLYAQDDETTTSPHGVTDSVEACYICHPNNEEEVTITRSEQLRKLDETCLKCHPNSAVHLAKMPTKKIIVPASFPLLGGQVRCFTCHDEPSCDKKEIDPKNPKFFREGPYPNLASFCRVCHGQKDLSRLNPHENMLKPDNSPNLNACFFCHTSAPSTEVAAKWQDSDFHIPPASLCIGCHSESPHAGVLEHSIEITGENLERFKQKEEELAISIPLSSDGKIICVTCHNPHPKGIAVQNVVIEEIELKEPLVDKKYFDNVTRVQVDNAFEEVSKEEEVFPLIDISNKPGQLLRIPITNGQLCQTCHDEP